VNNARAVDLLSETSIFGHMDQASIESIAGEGHERAYARGSIIFNEGDVGDAFYVLMDGALKVFVTSVRGEEHVLATLHPPDALGEVALLDGSPRSASASALEPSRLLSFARSRILELAARNPQITEALLRSTGTLLRRVIQQSADLVFLDLEGRVAKALIKAAETRGREKDGVVELELDLTQGGLASLVGGSRQSVNHILAGLQLRGFVEVRGRHLVVLDPPALRRRAGLG
jgi:CRP/FNR family transcriptional regulator, cyclic AMP receptor protein